MKILHFGYNNSSNQFISSTQEGLGLKKDGKLMIWFSSDKFPIEMARKYINEIWYDFEIYHQEKDILWYNQEILEIIKK